LDQLARGAECGLLEVIGPGITPGSGPGHLALFGYDPVKYDVGRGILSAMGIDFELQEGDVAGRINFATIDGKGKILDRRAGRIDSETNRRLCERIRTSTHLSNFDGEWYLETVSEHRAVIVLRGSNLSGDIRDTDPQSIGVSFLPPEPVTDEARRTAQVVQSFVDQARECLTSEDKANMILMRGFDRYERIPSLEARFKLKGLCVAAYPMYRGLSRLLGMEVINPLHGDSLERSFNALEEAYDDSNCSFYFLHVKKTDSTGEDGDFDDKVKAMEAIDRFIPRVANLNPDVLVVTGDHSTPALMKGHSWHPVPVMIRSEFARIDEVKNFDEHGCLRGSLGTRPGMHLMGLALAHARRLRKYGA
jgi:2,3-bisphosphoglycerate-independent phosphoglycerate mutase